MKLSIIIPVLNEAENIARFLQPLQLLRNNGHEIILVDGHSKDNTVINASSLVDNIYITDKSRSRQQNYGAAHATNEIILFLHADTILPENACQLIASALDENCHWGRFNVKLSGLQTTFRVIEFMINWRSCLTGIATGDQAIFVKKTVYEKVGGIPDIELMEDIEFSACLKIYSRPACIKTPVITSSRRWEKNGIIKTVLFMWTLRIQYFFGISPAALVKKYYP